MITFMCRGGAWLSFFVTAQGDRLKTIWLQGSQCSCHVWRVQPLPFSVPRCQHASPFSL